MRNVINLVVIKFIEENILSRFGFPTQIVIGNATIFYSIKMIEFFQKYQILLHHSTPYYPQGNGLAKSSNKTMVKVIKKTLEDHKKSWESHLCSMGKHNYSKEIYWKISFPISLWETCNLPYQFGLPCFNVFAGFN